PATPTRRGKQVLRCLITRRLAVVLAAAALAVGIQSSPGYGQGAQGNAGVAPPNSSAFGLSYGEWSARWWQWAYSLPVDHHPLFDTADCSAGQAGRVWFLGASFAPSISDGGQIVAIATRDCRVPTGTALFVPVLNAEAATGEGNG